LSDERRDFFVSYTGDDEAWATWAALQLEDAGYRVVVQAWDFGPGNFVANMEEAVQSTDWLLPVLSEAYLKSRYGRLEWSAYLRADESRLIPLQIEDIDTRSLLGPQVRISLVGLEETEARQRLLERIGTLVGPPGHPPSRRKPAPFPGKAPRISAVPAATEAEAAPEVPRRTIPISQDRIQLLVLGAGEAYRGAVDAFRGLLDLPPGHVADLFGSRLPAGEQLAEVARVLEGLDAEEVSDVLVVFAGDGSNDPDAGVRLHVASSAGGAPAPESTIGWYDLAGVLQRAQPRLRSYVVLDAADPDGGPVGPSQPGSVPVLKLDRGAGAGLDGIVRALAQPPDVLGPRLGHWGPLALADLARLALGEGGQPGAGELLADNPSGKDIGLVPNPLAWPQHPAAIPNWCWVVSATDERREEGDRLDFMVREQLPVYSRKALNKAYEPLEVELSPEPGTIRAAQVLSSPASFAHAIEQVCRAEVAIFDLTNFEPAVMILLGIRAVIRRGITVCVAGVHDPRWQGVEPPFHVREISLISYPGQPELDRLERRIVEGIRQFHQAKGGYSDLPVFDFIRGVPPEPNRRLLRAFDSGPEPSILALVPFEPSYVQRNWAKVRDNLVGSARAEIADRGDGRDEDIKPTVLRTLDLDSPRVVSAQLFEAIRLTDFCLVDLTTARPNVLFELGVRLAANPLHPVVVLDTGYPAPDRETAWLEQAKGQLDQLQRLLVAVEYSPTMIRAFSRMVARHLEFRRLLETPEHPRTGTVLGGLPPTGVYDLAWRHAVARDEIAVTPVQERLESDAEPLLVDRTTGRRQLVYPGGHPLVDAAERNGREHLVAAWLYFHFRLQVRGGTETDRILYQSLGERLINLLEETGEEADESFAIMIEKWLAEDGSGPLDEERGNHG
jgi:hypothetical protein